MAGMFNPSSPQQSCCGSPPTSEKKVLSLPPEEALPRSETLGGYIFVCNNETMQDDLRRQLFGLPARYRDSVRAIQPGLPLFLYNYSTHQLHGVFEAAGFGGMNLDPTAWETKKTKGESRFPAQVRIRVRRSFAPLDEEDFRPALHHYDGPKFRLQLSVPEALALLDLFENQAASGAAEAAAVASSAIAAEVARLRTFSLGIPINHHRYSAHQPLFLGPAAAGYRQSPPSRAAVSTSLFGYQSNGYGSQANAAAMRGQNHIASGA